MLVEKGPFGQSPGGPFALPEMEEDNVLRILIIITAVILGFLTYVFVVRPAGAADGTTAPVGSIAADIIMWTWAFAGPVVASLAAAYVCRLLQKEGYNIDAQRSFRLRQLIEHGLAMGAAAAVRDLQKNPSLDVKSALVASALGYVRQVGSTELKVLGFGLDFGKEQEALKSLVEAELSTLNEEHPAVKALDAVAKKPPL